MSLKEDLTDRLGAADIRRICRACGGGCNNRTKEELYALIYDADDRVGYNALWIFTHFSKEDIRWLAPKRNALIDTVLAANHTGKRRLILTLLDRIAISAVDVRTDYLDFCLSKINSSEPYGIRALCMKQAFAQCRYYPELMAELKSELQMTEYDGQSAGVAATRRNILKKIERQTRQT